MSDAQDMKLHQGTLDKPPVLRAVRILSMQTAATLLAKKRILFLIVLLGVPPFIATVAKVEGARLDEFMMIPPVALFLFISPMVTLFHGTSVFADEVDGRTLSYLLIRPIPREAILAGKLLGAWMVSTVLVCGSALLVHVPFAWMGDFGGFVTSPIWGDALLFCLALGGGVALYTLFSTLLGLVLKHPTLVGILYILIVEALFCWAPGPPSKLAMSYHLLRLLPEGYITPEETVAQGIGLGVIHVDSGTTVLGLFAAGLVMLALCVLAVRGSDFANESDQ